MVSRYENREIKEIFSDKAKLLRWEAVERAVIEAYHRMGKIDKARFRAIMQAWDENPPEVEWWLNQDKEIGHDLNAFIDERIRRLPDESLHQYVHKKITSYDTEEPAFARALLDALDVVKTYHQKLETVLINLAVKHRKTAMMAKTHGQDAELQTFGARCLTWLQNLRTAYAAIPTSVLNCSKLSGAIGKYGSIDPRLESIALEILGFTPYYGATQIMPRDMYASIAQALSNYVGVISKIAGDIRLGARSGFTIYREPFGKKQKGSSAMPHKKNTIKTEQLAGMFILAKGFAAMLTDCIYTWEERSIEQSCVERVAWPDLFHIVVHSQKVLVSVLENLVVYPEVMLAEIQNSRGTFASSEAKEFLKENGFAHEDAYRLVQLASFNVFELKEHVSNERRSIESHIPEARLVASSSVAATDEVIHDYNCRLAKLFEDEDKKKAWHTLFTPDFLLRNENVLYEKII